MSAIGTIWQERIERDDETPFFVLGRTRGKSEIVAPQMHSSYALSVYDVGKWLEDVTLGYLGAGLAARRGRRGGSMMKEQ